MENRKCSELFYTGSQGLRYFEILEVRYLRWVHEAKTPEFKSYADLHALLYKLNGLNEDAFRSSADTLESVLGNVATERTKQLVSAQTVPSVWWGEAATAASNMMAEQLRLAADDIDILRNAFEDMDAAPQALRAALAIIANAAAGISTSHDIEVEGKTPEDIDSIISYAEGDWSSTIGFGDTLLDKVNRIFPEHKASGMSGWSVQDDATTVYTEGTKHTTENNGPTVKLRSHCRWWLDNVFRKDYESNITEFVNACNKANQDVTDTYDLLVKAFAGLNATKYPCPTGSQTPHTTAPAGATTGPPAGPGAPSVPGTAGGPGAPSVPAQPAAPGAPLPTAPGGENPLSTVASLGTQLASSGVGTQLTEGLNGLLGSASEQVTSTLEGLREEAEKVINPEDGEETDAAGDGEPGDPDRDGEPDKDEGGDGESDADNANGVEFDGKQYKLEVGPDGQLKLVVEASEGDPETYRVEIGADGKPKILGEGESEEAAAPVPEGQQPTDPPVGAPGISTGQKQEDGEHQPQEYPPAADAPPATGVDTPPAPPADTGARLAEAGPL